MASAFARARLPASISEGPDHFEVDLGAGMVGELNGRELPWQLRLCTWSALPWGAAFQDCIGDGDEPAGDGDNAR